MTLKRHGTVVALVIEGQNGVSVTLISDTRFAVRSLFRTPGFSAITILTLGLGIGMSVAVWSVVDAVLIEPLPYPTLTMPSETNPLNRWQPSSEKI